MNAPASHSSSSPIESNTGEGRVRLAIVGTNFGAGIARNIARGNPYVQLAGVCDMDEAKAQSLASELGVPAYKSLNELLANPEIEAVGMFTPPVGRARLIQQILEAGRHVMTTKPFEMDLAAAQAVLKEAQERRLAVHMNSPAPLPSTDMAQIHTWIKEHNLGRPIAMRAETWADYREQANGSWYDDPARCPAAPIFRLGIYFLNDFAALLGNPHRVHVVQTRVFTGRPTADNAQLTIEYDNGSIANIFASFCIGDGKPWRDSVILNYERGTISRWVERLGKVDMSFDNAVLQLQARGVSVEPVSTQAGDFAGWYQWESFHRAIRSENPAALQDPESVLFGVRLLNAMARSALSGLPEFVN